MHYNFLKKIALGVVWKNPPSMEKDSGFSTQSCLKMSTLQSKIFSSFVSYRNLSDREKYVIKVEIHKESDNIFKSFECRSCTPF